MMTMHVKEFLMWYYVTVISFVCAGNRAKIYKIPYGAAPATMPKFVIMNDMQAAFYPITNNSQVVENVVSHMYNFKLLNAKMPGAMVFKLPHVGINKDHVHTDSILQMDRQQFMEPTFPNLTHSYMILRRFRLSRAPMNENISHLMKKEMEKIDQQDLNDDPWSNLGLNGWHGDIANPLNFSQSFPSKIGNDYPHSEIAQDLHGGIIVKEYLKDIAESKMNMQLKREEFMKEMDANIFLARSNDPFGYSTKWPLRKSNRTKHKRDVLRLYSMIQCSTGCEPLSYKGYGCYCGFLGNGVPTDGIDRCCKLHDKCYEQSNCLSYLEYFVPYVWKCYRGKPLCAIDHGEWGGPDSCAARLCYCDLRLSRCLREFSCPRKRAVCRSSLSRRFQNLLLVK
ncbi:uncharacterized protein LOC142221857 [Haematobia irritans]|uniref:uncharacterized protein LOC142221857 n=1 Tax=Haematobia irritans TaxID=7368 RepID=UPI003F4F4136